MYEIISELQLSASANPVEWELQVISYCNDSRVCLEQRTLRGIQTLVSQFHPQPHYDERRSTKHTTHQQNAWNDSRDGEVAHFADLVCSLYESKTVF